MSEAGARWPRRGGVFPRNTQYVVCTEYTAECTEFTEITECTECTECTDFAIDHTDHTDHTDQEIFSEL
jgi:hypothetical protein